MLKNSNFQDRETCPSPARGDARWAAIDPKKKNGFKLPATNLFRLYVYYRRLHDAD